MFKRTCSLLLAIVMVIGMLPMPSYATEAEQEIPVVDEVVSETQEQPVVEEPPVETTGEAPVETTEEAPVETTEEAPVETTEEAPVETTEEAPVETTEEAPLETTEEAPVETTEEALVETTEEAPLAEVESDEAAEEASLEEAEYVWDGETIATADDLLAFAAAVNAGDTFAGKKVTLTADIDLNGIQWQPIGGSDVYFGGEFDGNGKTISNLTDSTANDHKGLFAQLNNAYVHDLTLKDVNFSGTCEGSLYAGALVGEAEKMNVIESVVVDGITWDITSKNGSVGSIAGYSYDSNYTGCEVKNAEFNVTSTSSVNMGGMIGQGRGVGTFSTAYGNTSTYSYKDCTVEGVTFNVIGKTTVGGFLGVDGYNHWANYGVNCTVTGLEVNCAADDAQYTVGGFMGSNSGANYGKDYAFENCHTTGVINAVGNTNTASTFGGFLGYVGGRAVALGSCTANVTINVGAGDVGGFVGETQQYFAHEYKFENCEAAGAVSTDDGTAGGFVANIQHGGDGSELNVVITDCTASGNVTGTTVGGLVGNVNDVKNGTATGGTVVMSGNTNNTNAESDVGKDDNSVVTVPVVVTNWVQVADATWYVEGQTEFTLTTAEQLAGLAKLVNEGNTFKAVVIKLGADIDLTKLEWTPIGLTAETPFSGHLDGLNHTITGLNMASAYVNAGLFGYIKNNTTNYLCSFENVTFHNVTISNATNAGALFGNGKFAQRHEWYGGILQVHNVKVTGDVKIDAANAGAVTGSDWLGARLAASNVVVNANDGSYVHGSAVAGGVFASTPHSGGEEAKIQNITSNIDVRGEGIVGGIAGNAGWTLDGLTCTGAITATNTTNAGTIFGQIVDNNYWSKNVDYVGMTNLNGEGATLTIDGVASEQLFPALGWSGKAEFAYVEGKVHEKSALVSIDGGEGILMTWPEAMAEIEGKTADITLTLANGATWTWEYGIKLPADTILTIDLNGKTLEGTIFSEGDLTIKNGSLLSYEFTSAIESYGENAVLTIEDGVTVKSYRHALRIEGGKAVINGGVFQTWGRTDETDTTHALNAGGEFATEVTINGGEFRGMKYDNRAENPDSSAAVNAQNNATVTINGGKFGYGQNNTLNVTGTGKIIAEGGEFDQDPSAYVSEPYLVADSETTQGWFTVVLDKYVAKIGENKYETIEAAIAAAKDGDTITLMQDCTAAKTLRISNNVTLDLNGNTLSTAESFSDMDMFTITGQLTVKGEGSIYSGCDSMFNGNVTIEGNGTYTGKWVVFYAGDDAEVNVNGGTFTSEKASVLSVKETATVTKAANVAIEAPAGYVWENGTKLVPEVVEPELPVTFAGTTLDVGNSLDINFYITKSTVDATLKANDGYYVQITRSYANGKADDVVVIRSSEWVNHTYGYGVTYNKIAGAQMCDTMDVQVFYADGTPASEIRTDSVRAYAMRSFDNANDKLKSLLADMLNYGAAAQNFFGYNTADLANSQMTEAQLAYATGSVTMTDSRVSHELYAGSTLNLESRIDMAVYFKDITDEMAEIMYAKYTFTNVSTNESVEVNVEAGNLRKYSNNIWGVVLDQLALANAGQLVAVTVYNADGSVYATATDSVESYIARMNNADALYETIMKFATSAKAYFAN